MPLELWGFLLLDGVALDRHFVLPTLVRVLGADAGAGSAFAGVCWCAMQKWRAAWTAAVTSWPAQELPA